MLVSPKLNTFEKNIYNLCLINSDINPTWIKQFKTNWSKCNNKTQSFNLIKSSLSSLENKDEIQGKFACGLMEVNELELAH